MAMRGSRALHLATGPLATFLEVNPAFELPDIFVPVAFPVEYHETHARRAAPLSTGDMDSPQQQTGVEPPVPLRERTGSSPLIEMVSLPVRPTQKRRWDY